MKNSDQSHADLSPEVCATEGATVLSLLSGKWKLRILALMQDGPVRLSELQRLVTHATKKMLIDSLHSMEADGILTRCDLGGPIRHVEYAIAAPMRHPTADLINCLAQWALRLKGVIPELPK